MFHVGINVVSDVSPEITYRRNKNTQMRPVLTYSKSTEGYYIDNIVEIDEVFWHLIVNLSTVGDIVEITSETQITWAKSTFWMTDIWNYSFPAPLR